MIEEHTLFILGAGASKPYGFPTGKELRTEIIKTFPSEFKKLLSATSLREDERDRHLREAMKFVEHFSKTPIYSIDQFLAFNPNYSFYGKMAIAYYIRKHEIGSEFLLTEYHPYFAEDWYSLIFNRMMAGLKEPQDFEKFKENRVAFITFNYDRSLEYFLCTSFFNTFAQSKNAYDSRLEKYIPFPIIHVYGQISEWRQPWEDNLFSYRNDSITFEKIEGHSKGIHVIGERSVEEVKIKTIETVANYKRIYFCGFGFAKENLDVIGFPISIDESSKIYGTAKDFTPKEIAEARHSLVKKASAPYSIEFPIIENKNTYQLLREYL
jgi:hypothetical protein